MGIRPASQQLRRHKRQKQDIEVADGREGRSNNVRVERSAQNNSRRNKGIYAIREER